MAKRKRDMQLNFRVSSEELAVIEQKMSQLGTSNREAYLRKMALDGYVVKLELPELKELVSLMRRSSNNLNQLTRKVHETGRVYDADLKDKFLQRTIEIQQQMEALRQSKAQIASEDYNPGRLDMEAIEAALCEAVEMHDGLVSEDFIDLFVSQVTPLSDSRFAWCLDFSPQPTVAFLNLAGQRKYTTCSMDTKLHFGPFADEEGHTIPFPGSLRR